MSETKPGIPFGFPVYIGGNVHDAYGARVDSLAGFMFDRTKPQPAGLHQVLTDETCPFCHERLYGLSGPPNGCGRCVFDDGATVLVDPLPPDVAPLSCTTCNLTLYQLREATA